MSRVIRIEYKLQNAETLEVLQSNATTSIIGKEGMELKVIPFYIITERNDMPQALEDIITEMKVGEERVNIFLRAEEVFGEHDINKVAVLGIEQFPNKEDLVVGNRLYGDNDGQTVSILVKSFTDTEVTIDYNHEFAGIDLLFSVKILSSRDATIKEAASGMIKQ